MRRRFAISAAAIFAAIGLCNLTTLGQIRQAIPPEPAAKAARDAVDVPVKQVVIFNSGVGYFEHFGIVHEDAATELRFKTDQVNDILKSLVLQDVDGGTIGAVSYPGLAPLARTLKSFQVDIAANPDMADLLNQLRGAKLTISLKGEQPMTGVILGVEKKLRAVGEKAVVEALTLNLKVERKFHSIPLDQISLMELDDPKLQKELDDALTALTQARDQDKKPMTLHFMGKGDRHVRIGYLVETPIWKTSYRLVFDPADAAGKQKVAAPPATAPSEPGAGAAKGLGDGQNHPAKIQGWAIVENQTDNDWKEVELSLVSGRPLSFIQDLYHAQYIPRPIVEADNRLSLRPQTYSGGIYDIRDLTANIPDFTDAPDFSSNAAKNAQNQMEKAGGGIGGGGGGGGGNLFAGGTAKMANQNGPLTQPIDPTASIISAAKAARVGELFKYQIGNVSVARQTSAMIPIVTDDIDAERVSIYNAGVLADHPLLAARLRNNTKKFLLQGPVTVLDQGSYAGDARIDDLPPGQERLISFGIDQQLLIDAGEAKQTSSVVTGKIEKGVMTLTYRDVVEQTYLADNKSDETRLLVIEHPRRADFKLVTPAIAEETAADVYRFRRSIPRQKVVKFSVVQENVFNTSNEILSIGTINLAMYVKEGAVPQKVRDALTKAILLKQQLEAIEARNLEVHKQADELENDQKRIRENLRAVAADSDYYKRLMKKIDGEESEIEKLQKSLNELLREHRDVEKQLNDYVGGLTVE